MDLEKDISEEAKDFVEKVMSEYGVEPDYVEVTSYTDHATYNIRIVAGKEFGIETKKAGNNISISLNRIEKGSKRPLYNQFEMVAKQLAETLEDVMAEVIEVSGSTLRYCVEEAWVSCKRCGARVEVSDDGVGSFGYSDKKLALDRMSAYNREVLKLYLFGSLRRECACDFGDISKFRY